MNINIIKNYSKWDTNITWEKIEIDDKHPDWEQAWERWLSGQNPTDSPLWKFGIFAGDKNG